MKTIEKLCLKWNDFQANLYSAFGRFRDDLDFADVTLASDDGKQFEAHKIILASSSPFFMEVLRKNKHPHPLIYMRGVKAEELLAMLDFLYFGEASVNQESLEAFLSLAEELELKGLTNSSQRNNQDYETKPPLTENIIEQKKHQLESTLNVQRPLVEYKTETKISSDAMVSVDTHQLDEQVKSMMSDTGNKMTYGNQSKKVFACKVCGKESDYTNTKTHIEAKHIASNINHTCDICGKSSRSRDGLRQHKSKEHSR